MKRIQILLRCFILALVSFTRIPVPGRWLTPEQMRQMNPSKSMAFFPLIGGGLGVICWGVWALLKRFFPIDVLALTLLAIPIILTGAYHEDGFADVADSYGGYTREQRLTIMKDSRIGAFGAISIVLLLLGKFTLLKSISLPFMPVAVITALVLGRFCAMLPFRLYPYVGQTNRNANMLTFGNGTLAVAAIASLGILYLFLGIKLAVVFFMLVQAVVLLASKYLSHRLGGLTGDVGGAMEQIGELSTYILFMLLSYGTIHV